jgi:hypothetical protein
VDFESSPRVCDLLTRLGRSVSMKKLLVVGGMAVGVVGVGFLAKSLASRSGRVDFGRMVERMPENAPPRWIFRNVTEIRDNTERILRLLESESRSDRR